MKLILLFAFLALICMARSAPAAPTTPRVLILPDYNDEEAGGSLIEFDEQIADENVPNKYTDDDDDDDDDDDETTRPTTTTTTTTTSTRRSTYMFPTRNRNVIPSRRPFPTPRTSSVRTTTMMLDDDETSDETPNYDGDFKYIRDFRKYVQKLLDDIRKMVRNLTGYEFGKGNQSNTNNQDFD